MLYIGADHAGFNLKSKLVDYLSSKNVQFEDVGTFSEESVDYPLIAQKLCLKILDGDKGILICGTGIGMSIASNRFKNIRAALCYDVESAKLARNHNNANVLVLKGRNQDTQLSIKIVEAFLTEPFEGGRHQGRIDELNDL